MASETVTYFSKSIATGLSATSAYDLGRAWSKVYLEIPALSATVSTQSCGVFIYAAATLDGTYRPIAFDTNVSFPTAAAWNVSAVVSNIMHRIPDGFRYLKVELTSTVSNTTVFNIICKD